QKLADHPQHPILLSRPADRGCLGRDHEWNRVHAKSRYAGLDPEAHDLEDLGLDVRIGRIQVRLEFIETVEVPLACLRVIAPGRFLHSREDHTLARSWWAFLCPDVPVAVLGMRVAAGLLEPGVLVRGVVYDQVHDDPDTALIGRM